MADLLWIIWICVFQITISRVATLIAIETVYSWTCPLSPIRGYGEIAANVVQSVSTSIAVYAVITFERRMNKHLKDHQSLFKLVSFKGIVILQSAQAIIFPALGESSVFKPTPPYHLSYSDFVVGIPSFLVVWDMTVVAMLFLWSFDFKRYMHASQRGAPNLASPMRAFLSVFDVRDVWRALVLPFTSMKTPATRSMDLDDGTHQMEMQRGIKEDVLAVRDNP